MKAKNKPNFALLAGVSALSVMLAGCGGNTPEARPPHPLQAQLDQAEQAKQVALPTTSGPERVTVTRIQVLKDSTAYGWERGVYVIKDNETGKEYLGVSGIGITERGSHQSGKRRVSDER